MDLDNNGYLDEQEFVLVRVRGALRMLSPLSATTGSVPHRARARPSAKAG